MEWKEIFKEQTDEIGSALSLLQDTAPHYYDHLTKDILKGKLKQATQNGTELWSLRLYSYGDDPLHPLVSAFFFLRRRKKVCNPSHPNPPDPPGLWAYCLTVGAKDSDEGGLSSGALRDALNDRCRVIKKYHPVCEIMHLLDGPIIKPDNRTAVFAELHTNSQPPKFKDKGTIELGFPWVPLVNGQEVLKTFKWLEIIEGP